MPDFGQIVHSSAEGEESIVCSGTDGPNGPGWRVVSAVPRSRVETCPGAYDGTMGRTGPSSYHPVQDVLFVWNRPVSMKAVADKLEEAESQLDLARRQQKRAEELTLEATAKRQELEKKVEAQEVALADYRKERDDRFNALHALEKDLAKVRKAVGDLRYEEIVGQKKPG